jgi:ABC-type amino acid transport substrate-binding protein
MRRSGVLALTSLVLSACTSPVATPTSNPPTPVPASTSTPSTVSNEGGSDWLATALPFDERVGERFDYSCPPDGTAWPIDGTDIYTSISSVCTAAVHVGLITLINGGDVTIEMRPGQDSYTASRRNGVNSDSHGPWQASFVLVDEGIALTPAPASTPEPTPVATASPAATATPTPPDATATPGSADTPGPNALGLITPGQLQICMSFGRTNFADRDPAGDPFGVDVEIAQAMAEAMDLQPVIIEMEFGDLIDAVANGDCDVTLSGHFITNARLEVIDMIPYREGTPHVVVPIGNPLGINELTDLCGRRFGMVQGTIYVDMVLGQGDYEGEGLNDQCADAGAAAIDLQQFAIQSDAEDAFADGAFDAYAGNDFIVRERPGQFEWALELPRVRNGVGHHLGLDDLDEALRAGLRTIIDNGSYLEILADYGVQEVALTIRP